MYNKNLVEALDDIVDGYYTGCDDYNLIKTALKNYGKIIEELMQENFPHYSIQVIKNITGV